MPESAGADASLVGCAAVWKNTMCPSKQTFGLPGTQAQVFSPGLLAVHALTERDPNANR